MSLTYGFYNSVGNDRAYDATQMSKLFDGILRDGVFMSIGDTLMCNATSSMGISVGLGRAWFNHTWTNNDSILPLTVEASEIVLNRIDTIVLEVNSNNEVRQNTIKLIKGTPSSFPVGPVYIRTEKINQYPLCTIYIPAGITTITQASITNKVGTYDCPFVTGILETVKVDVFVAQWQSQYQNWYAQLGPLQEQWAGEFNSWFDGLETTLAGDIAGNLLVKINAKSHVYKGTVAPSAPTSIDFWVKEVN